MTTVIDNLGLAAVMLYAGHELLKIEARSKNPRYVFTEVPQLDLDAYRQEWRDGTLQIASARHYQEAFSRLASLAKRARSTPDGMWESEDARWLRSG